MENPDSMVSNLYEGGVLNFSIIQAEKNSGTGIVFGHGKYNSRVQVYSGDKYLTQSNITTGLGRLVGERKAKKYEWVSFDSTLRDMLITPDCPPLVRIVVYDCDRSEESKSLGEVHLELKNIVNKVDHIMDLPIVTVDQSGSSAAEGSIKLKVSFVPYPKHVVEVNTPNSVDCSRMNKLCFSIGWEAPPSRRVVPGADFGTALVMFDSEGKYVDSVDARKRQSTKGAHCQFETVMQYEGFTSDLESIFISLMDENAKKISSFFLVLLAKTDFSSLQELDKIYFRLVNGRSRKELYRYYAADIVTPSSSLILARFSRDPSRNNHWVMTPCNNMSYEARNQGYLIPDMRSMLSDIIPDCQGLPVDRIIALRTGESASMESLADDAGVLVKFAFVTKWIETAGKFPSLETGAMLVNESLGVVDMVTSVHIESSCGGIVRSDGGDEAGEEGRSRAETLLVDVGKVDPAVSFIAFYICPMSSGDAAFTTAGSEVTMRDAKYDCQLCDGVSTRELCSVSSEDLPADEAGADQMPSCLVGILFKLKDKWYFQNASSRAPSENVQDNINHFKKYATEKRVLITRTQINSKTESNVKRYANKT